MALQYDTANGIIYVYGIIMDSTWVENAVSARDFAKALTDIGDKPLTIRVNSPGGSVFEAMAIYNLLKNHRQRKETIIDGAAISASSWFFYPSDKITMAKNSMMMIHDPQGMESGTATEFRKTADVLDKMKVTIADMYADYSGKPAEDFANMMSETTWLTADEALALNLINEVSPNAAKKVENLERFRYKNLPKGWLEELGKTPRLDNLKAMANVF